MPDPVFLCDVRNKTVHRDRNKLGSSIIDVVLGIDLGELDQLRIRERGGILNERDKFSRPQAER